VPVCLPNVKKRSFGRPGLKLDCDGYGGGSGGGGDGECDEPRLSRKRQPSRHNE
jgi:hypothetical protein